MECQYGVLKQLLQDGFNVNTEMYCAYDGRQRTAVDFAVQKNNVKCVQLLVEYGATTTVDIHTSSRRHNPLQYAAEYGFLDCLKVMIPGEKSTDVKMFLSFALCGAARCGQLKCLQFLVEIFKEIDMENQLEARNENKNENLCKVLKDALPVACLQNEGHCVQYLVSILSKTTQEMTLPDAKQEEAMHQQRYFYTALCFAAARGYVHILKMLVLQLRIDINCYQGPGEYNPLLSAIAREVDTMYIDTQRIYANKAYYIEVDLAISNTIQCLIGLGTDVNMVSHLKGNTPLELCAYYGYLECTKIILQHNASNFRNIDLHRPLLCACMGGFVEIVHVLLQAGAEPNLRTDYLDGMTVLENLIINGISQMGLSILSDNQIESVKMVIKGGYDLRKSHFTVKDLPSSTTSKGSHMAENNTLLSLAKSNGLIRLSNILVASGMKENPSEHISNSPMIDNLHHYEPLSIQYVDKLKMMTRRCIIQTLGSTLLANGIHHLPLPSPMKNYLSFSEIDNL